MPETPTDADLLKLCDLAENHARWGPDHGGLPRFVPRLAAAVRRLLAERDEARSVCLVLGERVAAQAELLRRAEAPLPADEPP
jgi:hypothetical protein